MHVKSGNGGWGILGLVNACVMLAAVLLCGGAQRLSVQIQKWGKSMTVRQIMVQCCLYETEESACGIVRYTESDAEFIPLIRRMTDLYFPALQQKFGLESVPKVTLVVYPDEAELVGAIGQKRGEAPMGAYYGGVIHILSPRHWAGETETEIKDNFLAFGPLVHELTHYILDVKTKGNYEPWFSEGVALYYEYYYTGTEWRVDLQDAAVSLTSDDLQNHFDSLDPALAYRKSFDIIHTLTGEKGDSGLQDIIAGAGKNDATFSEIFLFNDRK